jgi:hypothetical protein
MKLTLAAAGSIRNTLEKPSEYDKALPYSIKVYNHIEINEEEVQAAKEALRIQSVHRQKRWATVLELRRLIAAKNHEVGVNDLLTCLANLALEIGQVKTQIRDLTSHKLAHLSRKDLEAEREFYKTAEKKDRPEKTNLFIGEEALIEAEKLLLFLKKRVTELEQKRAGVNASNTIEISGDLEEFLRELNLIV